MEINSIEKMVNHNLKKKIVDYTKNGECSNCGNCCGNLLPLTNDEVNRIKKYVRKHRIKENIFRPPLVGPVINYICPFRNDKEHKCDIYDIRPQVCRGFICNIRINDTTYEDFPNPDDVEIVNMRKTFYPERGK